MKVIRSSLRQSTTGERRAASGRQAEGIAFLQGGFRPFFLCGALWAVFVPLLLLWTLHRGAGTGSVFDPVAWHRHEMIFGYLGAIVAGFLLTAVPNWTGRPPITGAALAALAGLWLAARLAILMSVDTGILLAAVLDVGFFVVMAAVSAREVLAAKNRNLPVVWLTLVFGIAAGLDHAELVFQQVPAGVGVRLGLSIVTVMIALVGGRIIPAFTRNWLTKRGLGDGLPPATNRFDLAAIGSTAIAMLLWTALPESGLTAAVLATAAMLQLLRLARWSGLRTTADPLVLVLHLAYAWLPAALLLLAWSIVSPDMAPTAAMHALTAGAMACMTLAVMTRATLGHTGRPLVAGAGTVLLYIMAFGGAAVRVTAPWLPLDYVTALGVGGALWCGAFLLFVLIYGPMLLRPRNDGKA